MVGNDVENLLVFIVPINLRTTPTWLGVDLVSPEEVGKVKLNLQYKKKKKKIPGRIILFWTFLKCC